MLHDKEEQRKDLKTLKHSINEDLNTVGVTVHIEYASRAKLKSTVSSSDIFQRKFAIKFTKLAQNSTMNERESWERILTYLDFALLYKQLREVFPRIEYDCPLQKEETFTPELAKKWIQGLITDRVFSQSRILINFVFQRDNESSALIQESPLKMNNEGLFLQTLEPVDNDYLTYPDRTLLKNIHSDASNKRSVFSKENNHKKHPEITKRDIDRVFDVGVVAIEELFHMDTPSMFLRQQGLQIIKIILKTTYWNVLSETIQKHYAKKRSLKNVEKILNKLIDTIWPEENNSSDNKQKKREYSSEDVRNDLLNVLKRKDSVLGNELDSSICAPLDNLGNVLGRKNVDLAMVRLYSMVQSPVLLHSFWCTLMKELVSHIID